MPCGCDCSNAGNGDEVVLDEAAVAAAGPVAAADDDVEKLFRIEISSLAKRIDDKVK